MKINMTEWKQSILKSNQRIAIPILTHTGIEMSGKRVVDAVTDGRTHYEAIRLLSENYPASACTVIMDLTVEAEAFGAQIVFPDDEVPSVVGRLVSDRESIERLAVPTLNSARVPQYLLANSLAAQSLDKPVFAGCIGPFSLAGRLFDMSEIMMAMYIDPEGTCLLLDKCTSFITAYCKELKRQGANGVVMAEPAAGLLSNDACKEFSSVYIKKIVEKVQDDEFMVVLHNCGNAGHCTEAMLYTGADAYHFGNRIDMLLALKDCPPESLVMGNLDPVSLFKMASPDEVYSQTLRLLENTAGYSNFVLSSGCDIPPYTPVENIDSFYRALRDYNKSVQI